MVLCCVWARFWVCRGASSASTPPSQWGQGRRLWMASWASPPLPGLHQHEGYPPGQVCCQWLAQCPHAVTLWVTGTAVWFLESLFLTLVWRSEDCLGFCFAALRCPWQVLDPWSCFSSQLRMVGCTSGLRQPQHPWLWAWALPASALGPSDCSSDACFWLACPRRLPG